jgi:hypothetical protein
MDLILCKLGHEDSQSTAGCCLASEAVQRFLLLRKLHGSVHVLLRSDHVTTLGVAGSSSQRGIFGPASGCCR